MRHRLLSLVAAVLSVAADQPKQAIPPGDLQRLQGTWSVVAAEKDGLPLPPLFCDHMKLVFSGDKVTVKKVTPLNMTQEGRCELHAGVAPKSFVFWLTTHSWNQDGKQYILYASNPSRGIYRLDQDTLTICMWEDTGFVFHDGCDKLLTAFATKPDDGSVLLVLKREQP